MSEAGAAPSKVCVVCGTNVADKPRVKDAAGRYMCKACAEKQTAAKPAPAAKPAGGVTATATPKPASASAGAAKGAMPLAPEPGFDPVMASLVASSKQATSQACPNCKGWVKEGQLLCTSCGFNLEEGKQVRTRVQKERGVKEPRARKGPLIPEQFAPLLWVLGATVGGAIGAGIWYYVSANDIVAPRRLGYVAVLVGILSGVGATIAARNTSGLGSGIVAVLASIVAIGVGRYFALREFLDDIGMGGLPFEEWYFNSIGVGDFVGVAVAMFAAFKAGSTDFLSGGDD